MDIHPILVHFPVALLTLYSVFELVRFQKIASRPEWFSIKGVLVVFGTLGALAAYLTGPEGGESRLKEMHEAFATLTILVFGLISLSYIAEWWQTSRYSRFFFKPYIIIPLALSGLVIITITAGLGGAIVYGTDFDPFMAPIFKLLGIV